jgi:branched-subunit amino acid transport protein
MTLLLSMLAAGAVTFLIRLSFIGTAGSADPPRWFVRLLRFVPVAALSALVWPDLLLAGQHLSLLEPRCLAGVAAGLVAWRSGNILLTIGVGMAALWLLQWLA